MNIQLKFYPLHLLTAIVAGFIAYTIAAGTAQTYVHFAAEENEIGCFVIAGAMSLIALACSFEKVKK